MSDAPGILSRVGERAESALAKECEEREEILEKLGRPETVSTVVRPATFIYSEQVRAPTEGWLWLGT